PDFGFFVVFAEMRTGSNLLEANLNALADIHCAGEAFNPHFIGYPKTEQIGGVTRWARDEDPMRLITAIKGYPDVLAGFRYFGDHDPRVLDTLLDDPRCAKVVLTRNPVESYISLKVARETGQWKLTNVKQRKAAQIRFDSVEFEDHAARLQSFQLAVQHRLQATGQTAFYLTYEDLQDLDVLNGLAQFLGSSSRLDALDESLKKQNPAELRETVTNFDEMQSALSAMDAFGLGRTPSFEPRRGAAVPGFVTGAQAALLYMPVRSGPEDVVRQWLAALDDVAPADLPSPRNQKALRQWKRRMTGHRSFTVLRHPVARAHRAFCDKILSTGPGHYAEIRKTLRNFFKLPLPGRIDDVYDRDTHRAAFLSFIDFLEKNLAGQTHVRVDAHWATQAAVLHGMAQFGSPDHVLREHELVSELPRIAGALGYGNAPDPEPEMPETPFALGDIYDADIEARVKDVYQRDYMMFGFGAWG
ncbi:MAG: sulfotransferase family 2 domain-containing protein, partial [Pseudomonadota bacterium]